MKVVLLKDIKNLGAEGSVCEVGDGYALNFLIPQKRAVSVADAKGKALVQKHADREQKRASDAAAASEIFAAVPSNISMRMSVNDAGKLFQSVTPSVVCEQIKKDVGVDIPVQWVSFPPIKEIGEHTISISSGDAEKRVSLAIERDS